MRFPIAALAFSTLTLAATPALAGPPFICHAFDLSGSPSLPWGALRRRAGTIRIPPTT